MNHQAPIFEFIGPDRQPVHITAIEQHLQVADIIRQTSVPNYAQARIPIVSYLNLDAWEHALSDYHDKLLIEYMKFSFPLSIVSPNSLHMTVIQNHASAVNFPQHIQEYLDNECSFNALLNPLETVAYPHFHFSPLLSRPKNANKHRVILNLSHPYGASHNDAVTKNELDQHSFTL